MERFSVAPEEGKILGIKTFFVEKEHFILYLIDPSDNPDNLFFGP